LVYFELARLAFLMGVLLTLDFRAVYGLGLIQFQLGMDTVLDTSLPIESVYCLYLFLYRIFFHSLLTVFNLRGLFTVIFYMGTY
jgi:hypothetical protein